MMICCDAFNIHKHYFNGRFPGKYLICFQKTMDNHLSLPHGTNQKYNLIKTKEESWVLEV